MEVEIRVCGIPAIAHVTNINRVKPQGPTAPSDEDCYGGVTFDFEIMDRKGYRAKWLDNKLKSNPKEVARIESEIASRI